MFQLSFFPKAIGLKFMSNLFSFFIRTMGPRHAMKAMKSGLEQPAMKSGLGKLAIKSALGKAVKKQIAKPKAKGQASRNKNKLNKSNLEKLGQRSLDDKIQAAATSGGTVEEQAEALKDSLTKQEHAKVWGKHQTHLQKNPLQKGKLEGLSKKEKRVKAAEWLMKTASITRRQWALVLSTSLEALEKAARALEKVLERTKEKGKALEKAKGLASWPSKTKRRRKRKIRRRVKKMMKEALKKARKAKETKLQVSRMTWKRLRERPAPN